MSEACNEQKNNLPIVYGIVDDSIVDGPGIRLAIFLQGCPHRCKGCHNPESQPFESGNAMNPDDIMKRLTPLTAGVTISGGEPFSQPEAVLAIIEAANNVGIDNIWIWSGWKYEELMDEKRHPFAHEILDKCTVLVDGPFIEDLHESSLKWRGSSNQRIIDLNKSSIGHIKLYECN